MDLGIRIGVDSREVTEARKSFQGLRDEMETLRDGDPLNFGEGLDGANESLKELSKQINRLKTIVSTTDKKGGIIDEKAFKSANKLSQDILKNFKEYKGALRDAEVQLEHLMSRRVHLQKVESSSPYSGERKAAGEELKTLGPKIDKLIDKISHTQMRGDRMDRDFTGASDAMGGFNVPSGGMGGMFRKGFGGAMKTLGLVGLGISAASMLHKGIERNEAYSINDASLMMRGGRLKDFRSDYQYGYTPTESLGIADVINRGTGYGGGDLKRMGSTAQLFSRSSGVGADAATGFMTSLYPSTGMNPQQFDKYMREVRGAAKSGGFMGRIEQYMQSNARLVEMISRGRGGAPLSTDEISKLNLLQSTFWKGGGMLGQGESGMALMSALDQGIRGGGRGGNQQMFMMNALGFDGGIEGLWKYKQKKEEGLTGENLQRVLEYTQEIFGSGEGGGLSTAGKYNISNMFNLSAGQVEKVSEMYSKGLFSQEGTSKGVRELLAEGSDMEGDFGKYKDTMGFHTQFEKARGESISLRGFEEITGGVQGVQSRLNDVGEEAVKLKDKFIELNDAMKESVGYFDADFDPDNYDVLIKRNNNRK